MTVEYPGANQMIALVVILIPYVLMFIDMTIGRIQLAYLRREAHTK
jgi:hypothetical protein